MSDHAICVACGHEIPHLWRMAYRRCNDCVTVDRPHSLALARQVRGARWGERFELDDYDPSGCAAAA